MAFKGGDFAADAAFLVSMRQGHVVIRPAAEGFLTGNSKKPGVARLLFFLTSG